MFWSIRGPGGGDQVDLGRGHPDDERDHAPQGDDAAADQGQVADAAGGVGHQERHQDEVDDRRQGEQHADAGERRGVGAPQLEADADDDPGREHPGEGGGRQAEAEDGEEAGHDGHASEQEQDRARRDLLRLVDARVRLSDGGRTFEQGPDAEEGHQRVRRGTRLVGDDHADQEGDPAADEQHRAALAECMRIHERFPSISGPGPGDGVKVSFDCTPVVGVGTLPGSCPRG